MDVNERRKSMASLALLEKPLEMLDIKELKPNQKRRRNTVVVAHDSLVGKSFDFITLQSNAERTTANNRSEGSENEYEEFK